MGEWLVVAGTPAAFRTCRSQPPHLHDITCFRPATSFSLHALHPLLSGYYSPITEPLPFLVLTWHPFIVRYAIPDRPSQVVIMISIPVSIIDNDN